MSNYLSRTELQELTGYQIRSAVIRWLDRGSWPYATGGPDGWPRVLRSYHDARLAGVSMSKSKKSDQTPNWSR